MFDDAIEYLEKELALLKARRDELASLKLPPARSLTGALATLQSAGIESGEICLQLGWGSWGKLLGGNCAVKYTIRGDDYHKIGEGNMLSIALDQAMLQIKAAKPVSDLQASAALIEALPSHSCEEVDEEIHVPSEMRGDPLPL